MTLVFGSTVFYTVKFIKNHGRSRLTDSSLLRLLKLATPQLDMDIPTVVAAADHLSFHVEDLV